MRAITRIGQVLTLFLLVGCGRNTDFLHHVIPTPLPEEQKKTFQVKDLVGDNKVDILWIIDNSSSMSEDQLQVIQNTQLFMDEFTKKAAVDWKMGLLSTDEANAPFIGFTPSTLLNKSTPNAVSVFQGAVRSLGIAGSGYEMLYKPVMNALTRYPDFLRKEAMFAFIHISDAPEQSRYQTQTYLDFLAAQKGSLHRVLGYGVLWPQEWCPAGSGDEVFSYAGSLYEELFTALKGKTYALCKPDFGKDLADLGKDIVKRISSPRLPLAKRPRVSSIKVMYKDKDLPGGLKEEGGYWLYDFDLNAIVFHDLEFAPGDKEEVSVTYREDDGSPATH